jgi:hypothetical protein
LPKPPGAGVPVHADATSVEQQRPARPVASRAVHGAADGRWKRDEHDLAALASDARMASMPGAVRVELRAELVLPTAPVPPGHHHTAGITMFAADGPRDPDHPNDPPARAPGARDVPLSPLAPADSACPSVDLLTAGAVLAAARKLALGLLEQLGVEDTAVLRDGALEPRAATAADQQLVHQHAAALGLPVEALSPAGRVEQDRDLKARARALVEPPPP